MSICETDIVLITKTTFKRVNNVLLFNNVWFFLAGLQNITNFHAGQNWLQGNTLLLLLRMMLAASKRRIAFILIFVMYYRP